MFDLVVRVETLVGDGVPSLVRTFVNQAFRVQFALQYRKEIVRKGCTVAYPHMLHGVVMAFL